MESELSYVNYNLQYMDEKDYAIYLQVYDEMRSQRRKPRPQATMPGKIEHQGPPLDFSFLKLQDVQSLRKERPRAGKRKPIEKDDEEEDEKSKDQAGLNPAEDKMDGDKPKEAGKELVTIRNTHIPLVNSLLAQSVSLQATKGGMIGAIK